MFTKCFCLPRGKNYKPDLEAADATTAVAVAVAVAPKYG